jgi:hypothetical protein
VAEIQQMTHPAKIRRMVWSLSVPPTIAERAKTIPQTRKQALL